MARKGAGVSRWQILEGDALERLREMEPESIDAIVTDPPYGLHFMGKTWDSFGGPLGRRVGKDRERGGAMKAGEYDSRHNPEFQDFMMEIGKLLLAVAKPGAHLVAFGGTRTVHRLACALEDAGWEIRDQLAWVYGSGFPKSLDVSKAIDKSAGAERGEGDYDGPCVHLRAGSDCPGHGDSGKRQSGATVHVRSTAPATDAAKQWDGWGTALKPAWEPIVLARKPFAGSVAANVMQHGTGALNVDECRVSPSESDDYGRSAANSDGVRSASSGLSVGFDESSNGEYKNDQGRWPANLVHDGSPEVVGMFPESKSGSRAAGEYRIAAGSGRYGEFGDGPMPAIEGSEGSAARFFYTAKASSSERNAGLEGMARRGRTLGHKRCSKCGRQRVNVSGACECPDPDWVEVADHSPAENHHPTVKPIALMRWLCRMVTPPGGLILDPFLGSGTTMMAALQEGFRCVGIEREEQYVAIARRRVEEDAPLFNRRSES